MCGCKVHIHSATAGNERGKTERKIERKKKPQDENIMACPIPYGGNNKTKVGVDLVRI